jgi:hypothetical protein
MKKNYCRKYSMKTIKILSRLGENTGYCNNDIAFFDKFDDKAFKNVRHFLLINEGIKLMFEPWGWKNHGSCRVS